MRIGLNPSRLLPPERRLGWTPFAWLIYLVTFLVEPVIRTQHSQASALYWAATLAGLVVFLVVYFRGFWERGVRLLRLVGVQTLLGVAFAPINTGAAVFFVYAAAAAAFLDDSRRAFATVLGIVTIGSATCYITAAPLHTWILATAVTLLIGGVNVHFAGEARAQASLRLAHEEIEHLAAVAERERIGRDVHDVLGHTLSLIVLKSELASRLAERDPDRAAAEMRDVEAAARRTLQEVREAIRGYSPTLADEGARAAAMLKAAGVRVDLELGDEPLPRAVEETLALALREGVTNVARHSGATRCIVRLERRAGEIALVVTDDGRGFGGLEGSGLRGMRQRVEAFGGSVDVSSDRGARLRVALPVAVRTDALPPAGVG